jgi:hypothetical protein
MAPELTGNIEVGYILEQSICVRKISEKSFLSYTATTMTLELLLADSKILTL